MISFWGTTIIAMAFMRKHSYVLENYHILHSPLEALDQLEPKASKTLRDPTAEASSPIYLVEAYFSCNNSLSKITCFNPTSTAASKYSLSISYTTLQV